MGAAFAAAIGVGHYKSTDEVLLPLTLVTRTRLFCSVACLSCIVVLHRSATGLVSVG
jgi:hypothetical protein